MDWRGYGLLQGAKQRDTCSCHAQSGLRSRTLTLTTYHHFSVIFERSQTVKPEEITLNC